MYVGHIAAYRRTRSPGRLAWSEGRRPPGTGAGLHTSDEPDELSQWPSHDDSIINIVICYYYYYSNVADFALQVQLLAVAIHYISYVITTQQQQFCIHL